MSQRLYMRIADRIAAEIDSGVYPPGSYLPNMEELAKHYNASKGTLEAAQNNLRARGYLYTGYVDGYKRSVIRNRNLIDLVVTDTVGGAPRNSDNQDVFSEIAARLGMEPTKRFTMAAIPAPADIAARLGVEPGDFIVRRRVIQLLDGEPWGLEDGHYPLDLARELGLDSPTDIPEGTTRVLAAAGHADKAVVDEAFHWPVGPEEASIFEMPTGAALIGMVRTVASSTRITRVMRYARVAQRVRLVWRLGDPDAAALIDNTRNRSNSK